MGSEMSIDLAGASEAMARRGDSIIELKCNNEEKRDSYGCILNKIIIFKCRHILCLHCFETIRVKVDDDRKYFQCPLCRQFSAEGDMCKQDLMVNVNNNDSEQTLCFDCGEKPPTWKCVTCEHAYCKMCKRHHASKRKSMGHEFEQLCDEPDLEVNCPKHRHKECEFFCPIHDELTCSICIPTRHAKCQDEITDIDGGLDLKLVKLQTETSALKHRIFHDECMQEENDATADTIRDEYQQLEAQIKETFERSIARAERDRDVAMEKLRLLTNKQLAEINATKQHNQNRTQGHKNMAAVSEHIQAHIQGANQIHTIQKSNIVQHLIACQNDARPQRYESGLKAKFTPTPLPEENMVGSVGEKGVYSKWITQPLDALQNLSPHRVSQFHLGFGCYKFSKSGSNMYFVDTDNNQIHVYALDEDGSRCVRRWHFEDFGRCHSVQCVDSEIIIASSNGIFHTATGDPNFGINCRKMVAGDFVDVAKWDNRVYALDRKGVIRVFDATSYTQLHHINIHVDHKYGATDSIQVTPDRIYVAIRDKNKIKRYDHAGHLAGCDSNIESPMLCGADANGSLLVLSEKKAVLEMIRVDDNRISELPVFGLKEPLSAILDQNQLFVTQYDDENVKVFEYDT